MSNRLKRLAFVLALPCVLLSPLGAHADPACVLETARAELRSLRARLNQSRQDTRLWAHAWGIGYGAATVGGIAWGLITDDTATREDKWIGAASSALGLLPTVISPPRITKAAPWDESAPAVDLCRELAAERARQRLYAQESRDRTAWQAYASSAFVNLLKAAVMGPAFGHWSAAGWALVTGVPIGALSVYTYPRGVEQADSPASEPGASRVSVSGWAGPGQGGVLLSCFFR